MEKLIVLVTSKSSRTISTINLLQKYIEVIGTAFFVAAGIKYFSAYMQANRIIDATVSLRMGVMETPDKPSPE